MDIQKKKKKGLVAICTVQVHISIQPNLKGSDCNQHVLLFMFPSQEESHSYSTVRQDRDSSQKLRCELCFNSLFCFVFFTGLVQCTVKNDSLKTSLQNTEYKVFAACVMPLV